MQCDLDFDLIFTKSKSARAVVGIYGLRKCGNDILTAMDARLQTNRQTNKQMEPITYFLPLRGGQWVRYPTNDKRTGC